MAHEPKKRHSRARQGKRRKSIAMSAKQSVLCSQCGKDILPHAVCKHCGYYKNQPLIIK